MSEPSLRESDKVAADASRKRKIIALIVVLIVAVLCLLCVVLIVALTG